jgi:pyridoxal phosphate enzyme (YggS family)
MTALQDIRARMAQACTAAGRAPDAVQLVAVSKTQPPEKIAALLAQGHRVFGENRLQEAQSRWPDFEEAYPDIQLHFIGRLQTNKADDAVALFDVIETVDSIRLADALKNAMEKQGRFLPCFLQVNTGDEAQKGGVSPPDLPALYRHCAESGLAVKGLMCIPPANEPPDMHFALLHKLSGELGLSDLSMGMSGDFETAIRYGATHIRVGTALFGIRENNISN